MQVEQPNASTKSFTFNVTFEPAATQEDVFENSGVKKLVDMAVEGSVISYRLYLHHHHHRCHYWTLGFHQRVSIASYTNAGIAVAEMFVRLSVCHTLVLYQKEQS